MNYLTNLHKQYLNYNHNLKMLANPVTFQKSDCHKNSSSFFSKFAIFLFRSAVYFYLSKYYLRLILHISFATYTSSCISNGMLLRGLYFTLQQSPKGFRLYCLPHRHFKRLMQYSFNFYFIKDVILFWIVGTKLREQLGLGQNIESIPLSAINTFCPQMHSNSPNDSENFLDFSTLL